MCVHLTIAWQTSKSRGHHHSGLAAFNGWLSLQIGCRAFFLLHLRDFLIQVFIIVLVVDVNQVDEGILLAIEFELFLCLLRAIVIVIFVLVFMSLNVKDTGLVGCCFEIAAASSTAIQEEHLSRGVEGGRNLIGIHLKGLGMGLICCLLSGLQPIPLWVNIRPGRTWDI